ncbi:MAG TPA: tRNA pseudouridine(38-40) synthase TruA, partial [Burkholderiales bacterium]|nr:tRNA pseudouridine(38-40) synthase TruA [Burkholderiales bacterium]
MRIALGIEYDGSRFLGWQTQPGGGAVQDALEPALSRIAAGPVQVSCAGRTDRGVHARGQVVHFDADVERPDSAWIRGVNALLPESIAVLWARRVEGGFHARYSALARMYRYVLLNRPVRPALSARHAGWFHAPLDAERMRSAAALLVGEHDFSAFRASDCQARSPVRTLLAFEIAQRGERIDFVLKANGFLHHMVRNLVGTLIYVGKGKHPPAWAGEVLASRDRARAAPTFGAEGL